VFLSHLECTACGARHDARELATVCERCASPLAARYDLARAAAALPRAEYEGRAPGLWSLAEVLPLSDPAAAVSLGEGGTPLLGMPRLAARLGLASLLVKDEALNPTGSFKARGMSVAVSMARALCARALAAPSAGNAGGALAAYGARAGLPVHVAMPEDAPLANRVEAEACGAHVTLVPGTIADCGAWIRARAAREGWFDVSTLKEPYRVEGKKTMGYELARQCEWTLPDVVLYPTGGGTGLVGMWKAFEEMRALGWLAPDARLPRMVVVQARGCAPIVEAFARGAERATPPAQPATCAAGLRVPNPIGDRWMLEVLRDSGGCAVAVDDAELVAATREWAATEGLFAAPEGGALVAALRRLIADGTVAADERVVLFNTGTGLKYLECFR
jgi:threonine synthase